MARALISTSDKSGLGELVRALADRAVEIISTGATAEAIRGYGVAVTSVGSETGFDQILDGRVKTLHPSIFGGILADRSKEHHLDQLAELGIEPIDLVVVNLYPFTETVRAGAPVEECLEQIDIGGPALIRAAAKNHAAVTVLTTPRQYPTFIQALAGGGISSDMRAQFAAEAFAYVATYDIKVAAWYQEQIRPESEELPEWIGVSFQRNRLLRYGENPHQRAALYESVGAASSLATAELIQGKQMSYNNYLDADIALRAVSDFSEPCVAIIKHNNPCGLAVAESITAAHEQAHACDPLSAFGAVVAANQRVGRSLAAQITDVFTEVVLAPSFDDDALAVFQQKPSMRVLQVAVSPSVEWEVRMVDGGALMQTRDRIDSDGDQPQHWRLVSGPAADSDALADLEFAWRSVRSVKSNAIVIAANRATVGIGMGQVNRVDAARLATARAGDRARGAVAASDAFFPFPDGLEVLIDAGITAVVQPGGSVRDDEVIARAQAAGLTMYLTGVRHFTH